MSKSVIFVFTGTGNSLWVARQLALEFENCEIRSMGYLDNSYINEEYENIGFVFPTYGGGLPSKVLEFVKKVEVANSNPYVFAVATCGRISRARNATVQLRNVLKRKGIKLDYAEKLDMFSNYVVMYDMKPTVAEECEQSLKDLVPIVKAIKNKEQKKTERFIEPIRQIGYYGFLKYIKNMDKDFNVSDTCTSCKICVKVCPVNNITSGRDGKPEFKHYCEQCLGCLQFCPQKSINYKDKTQNRGRYHHPDIQWLDLYRLHGDNKFEFYNVYNDVSYEGKWVKLWGGSKYKGLDDDYDLCSRYLHIDVVYECIEETDDLIVIKNYTWIDDTHRIFNLAKARFCIVDTPKFLLGDKVLMSRDRVGTVVSICWHHKEKYHFYFVRVDGKVLSGRYKEDDFIKKIEG